MEASLREVALAVRRLHWQHHRDGNRILAPLGLSLGQWEVLRNLALDPDASLHRLAEATHQTDQAMGELARRMADRGLIARVDDGGRAVHHRITEQGEATRQRAAELLDGMLDRTIGSLTAQEQEELLRLATKAVHSVPAQEHRAG